LLDLGARLNLPGLVKDDGSPAYPDGYADYIVNHERMPGVGPLAGWRGENGDSHGKGAVNPNQLEKYIENGCFWSDHFTDEQLYYKHSNRAYLDYAHKMGWIGHPDRIIMHFYSEILQSFRLAGEGHGPHVPPEKERERIVKYFDPYPIWYEALEEKGQDLKEYPIHALTQRPMHMYHSWGSQNAWLRQLTAQNRLYMSDLLGAELDIGDDDWVRISSRHGAVKGQVRLMAGVNKNTVWTWNAIGKRKGTWGLSNDAPEATKGFLLNHVISELFPPRADGYSYSNSDPITGQAAWFDLRVKIEKCDPVEGAETDPMFAEIPKPKTRYDSPDILQYGAEFDGPMSGKTDGQHMEWIGHRHENAVAGRGVRDGVKNKISSSDGGDAS
jgi:anaerobic selenocysteine-containing dehydrogenase